MGRKAFAEFLGTFWLTFGGCGSAVLAAKFFAGPDQIGIGLVGVSLAFGLTVLTMAYAIGHISGCHLNPAVTAGLVAGRRFPAKDAAPYILAQVGGALAGAFVLFAIAGGKDGSIVISDAPGTFATNGYGDYSASSVKLPDGTFRGGYSLVACLSAEVVLTAFFLFIILGATDKLGPPGFAPIPIGLGLTLIHLIGIPVTNLSVNPARSTGPAVVAAVNGVGMPLQQLWLFWVAPVVGAVVGAVAYGAVSGPEKSVAATPPPSAA